MAAKSTKSSGMTYDALRRQIKEGNMGGTFLFYGEETYLRDIALADMQKALIPPGMESFNLHLLGSDCTLESLSQAVNALPMLCDHMMIVVKDFDLYKQNEAAQQKLIALLEDVPDYCTLIFVYDTLAYKADARKKIHNVLKKNANAVEFALNDASRLVPWVRRHFQSGGKDISQNDAQYLLFRVGMQMSVLLGEINKLALFARGDTVTRQEIDQVVIPCLEAEAFQLAETVCKGKRAEAFDLLDRLFSLRQEPIAIVGAMGWQLRRIYTAALVIKKKGTGDMLTQLIPSMQAYSARMTMQLAQNTSPDWCRRALQCCAEADFALKNSGGEPRAIMEELLLRLMGGVKA